MPVPLIACRNRETGALAEIPETALAYMTDWVPVDQADEEPGEAAAAATEPRPPSPPATKSKAAKAATSSTKED